MLRSRIDRSCESLDNCQKADARRAKRLISAAAGRNDFELAGEVRPKNGINDNSNDSLSLISIYSLVCYGVTGADNFFRHRKMPFMDGH